MVEERLKPELMAVIAAAIALVLDKPHRILAVGESTIPQETVVYMVNPWSMEGRFEIFRSHRVR